MKGEGFRISGFGFVSGFGFRATGFGFRVSGFGFRVSGFGFWVPGFGFRLPGFGFLAAGDKSRVSCFGFRPMGQWAGGRGGGMFRENEWAHLETLD